MVIGRRCILAGVILAGGCFTDAEAESTVGDGTGGSGSSGSPSSSTMPDGSTSTTSSDVSSGVTSTSSSASASESSSADTSGGDATSFVHEIAIALSPDLVEPIVALPLLLRLRPSSIDYAAAGDGSDLRFFAMNGIDPIDFEIEFWNPGGESIVWIRHDDAEPSDATIIMRYGDPGLLNVPNDPRRVWERYEAVWHMTPPMKDRLLDSASAPAHASPGEGPPPMFGPANIGPGLVNTDGSQSFRATNNKLAFSATFTLMAWVNVRGNGPIDDPPTNRAPLSSVSPFVWELIAANHTDQRAGLGVFSSGAGAGVASDVPLEVGSWHHLCGVFNASDMSFYVDGTRTGFGGSLVSSVDGGMGEVQISGREFEGDLDEVRVSSAVLSAERIQLEFASMNDPDLLTVGPKMPYVPDP